jgi:phosphatidylserine/phosphatidylglycerophosphate/cardiolipin synthase-like enzyme
MKREPRPYHKAALRFFFFVFLLAPKSGWAEMAVQACFSPEGRCSNQILREIGQAKSEVLAAVYALTSDELAWALVQAHKRGLKVQVILDRGFDKDNEHSKGLFLSQQRVPLRRISGFGKEKGQGEKGLMHQKFAVIDRTVVLTGSYNWTLSADRFNHENLLVFRDARPLAEEYRKQFFRLWENRE